MGSGTSSSMGSGARSNQQKVKLDSQGLRLFKYAINTALQISSLGFLRIDNGGIAISDPITGIVNNITKLKDIANDLNWGIWLGKQALDCFTLYQDGHQSVGVYTDSFLFNGTNVSVSHAAVLINGKIYSFEGYQKSCASIIETTDTNYEWKYKGECYKSNTEIKNWIDSFNKSHGSYNIISYNCQDVADEIIRFAEN